MYFRSSAFVNTVLCDNRKSNVLWYVGMLKYAGKASAYQRLRDKTYKDSGP